MFKSLTSFHITQHILLRCAKLSTLLWDFQPISLLFHTDRALTVVCMQFPWIYAEFILLCVTYSEATILTYSTNLFRLSRLLEDVIFFRSLQKKKKKKGECFLYCVYSSNDTSITVICVLFYSLHETRLNPRRVRPMCYRCSNPRGAYQDAVQTVKHVIKI